MTRSLKTRIERLEDDYRPPVAEMEEIDCQQLVRRLGMLVRLAASGDEEAMECERQLLAGLEESSDESDEQDRS